VQRALFIEGSYVPLMAVPSGLVPAIGDFTVDLGTYERLATLLAGATHVAKVSRRP
jgi:hypothetical protein